MKTNAKKLLAALLAVSLSGAMAACGGGSGGSSAPAADNNAPAAAPADNNAPAADNNAPASDSGKMVLSFWHAMGGKGGEALTAMVNAYNAASDKYEVKEDYQGGYDDELTKLKTAMQSGIGPDICQVYDIGSKYMVDTGYIVPMQDFIDKDSSFNVADLEPNCVNYYSIGGRLQSMPFNTSMPVLYYNKTAFEEAGLDPNTPPKNFDEIAEYAAKLNKEGQAGYAMAIYGWFFEQLIATQGELYADNENGRSANASAVAFDSNGSGLKIVEAWKSLLDSGNATNYGRATADTMNAFFAGRVAMILESSAQVRNVSDSVGGRFEVGVGFFPHIGNNPEGGNIIGGGSLWSIDNHDDARKDGVWDFVKYAVSPESQLEWHKGTGYICVNSKVYELDGMKALLEENPNFGVAPDQLHSVPTNIYTGGALLGVFSEARATFETNMEGVINGSMSPEECINTTASTINAAIANYNSTTQG